MKSRLKSKSKHDDKKLRIVEGDKPSRRRVYLQGERTTDTCESSGAKLCNN